MMRSLLYAAAALVRRGRRRVLCPAGGPTVESPDMAVAAAAAQPTRGRRQRHHHPSWRERGERSRRLGQRRRRHLRRHHRRRRTPGAPASCPAPRRCSSATCEACQRPGGVPARRRHRHRFAHLQDRATAAPPGPAVQEPGSGRVLRLLRVLEPERGLVFMATRWTASFPVRPHHRRRAPGRHRRPAFPRRRRARAASPRAAPASRRRAGRDAWIITGGAEEARVLATTRRRRHLEVLRRADRAGHRRRRAASASTSGAARTASWPAATSSKPSRPHNVAVSSDGGRPGARRARRRSRARRSALSYVSDAAARRASWRPAPAARRGRTTRARRWTLPEGRRLLGGGVRQPAGRLVRGDRRADPQDQLLSNLRRRGSR